MPRYTPDPAGSRRRLPALLAAGVLLSALLASVLHAQANRAGANERAGRELVVLVHGLGRTPMSMLPMRWALERVGYDVVNWGYSSTTVPVPELGASLADRVAREIELRRPVKVHFVTHSLGGIITRWMLANRPPDVPGRVVMLAPPNQGAAVADRLSPYLGWLLRPLPELRTDSTGIARSLALPAGREVGVVAAAGDGKVRVAETRLEGQTAHVVVPGAHTFIMMDREVQRLTLAFLRTGRFPSERGKASEPDPREQR